METLQYDFTIYWSFILHSKKKKLYSTKVSRRKGLSARIGRDLILAPEVWLYNAGQCES